MKSIAWKHRDVRRGKLPFLIDREKEKQTGDEDSIEFKDFSSINTKQFSHSFME